MRLRITSIDEFQFLTCIKHELWGSKRARFKSWQVGDYLAFIVDKAIAGLAEVTGNSYYSEDRVWDNGLFPHRIPLKFVCVSLPDHRPRLLGEVRDTLTSAWGTKYGLRILNQQLLEGKPAETIVGVIRSAASDLPDIEANIETYLTQAKVAREAASQVRRKPGRPSTRVEVTEVEGKEPVESKEEESAHLRMQGTLIQLGQLTKCTVWIASNDRNREYGGKTLGEDCLSALPNLGLSQEATRKISMIDVIWLRQNAPLCAFEVETTTSIYSGLLRMSDLLALVPALKIDLFVVAQRERQNKVMAELARPTFKKIGLSDYCRFIAIEDLDDLYLKVKNLGPYFEPGILDNIAVQLEEVKQGGLK